MAAKEFPIMNKLLHAEFFRRTMGVPKKVGMNFLNDRPHLRAFFKKQEKDFAALFAIIEVDSENFLRKKLNKKDLECLELIAMEAKSETDEKKAKKDEAKGIVNHAAKLKGGSGDDDDGADDFSIGNDDDEDEGGSTPKSSDPKKRKKDDSGEADDNTFDDKYNEYHSDDEDDEDEKAKKAKEAADAAAKKKADEGKMKLRSGAALGSTPSNSSSSSSTNSGKKGPLTVDPSLPSSSAPLQTLTPRKSDVPKMHSTLVGYSKGKLLMVLDKSGAPVENRILLNADGNQIQIELQ